MGRGGRDDGSRFVAPLRNCLSRHFRRCGGFRGAPSRSLPLAKGPPRIPDDTILVSSRSYAEAAPTARDLSHPRGRSCTDLAAGVAGFTVRPLGARNGPGLKWPPISSASVNFRIVSEPDWGKVRYVDLLASEERSWMMGSPERTIDSFRWSPEPPSAKTPFLDPALTV